ARPARSDPPVADRAELAYDEIGIGYAGHRRADPRIAARIHRALGDAASVLDVGAGTGSYEPPGRRVVAVEPSPVMLAQRPVGAAPAVRATAGALPVRDGAFDAALVVLSLHHWPDPWAGLAELRRVARRQVVLTFDPVDHEAFWLVDDYLPAIAELASAHPPGPAAVAEALGGAVEVVPVPHDCVDGFMWAWWRRPEAYLDAGVRAAISAIAQLPPGVVEPAMARLADDLATGRWHERHGHLLARQEIDGGFRLVVAGPA
ncbi:MAG: SAM-dependent methyltransferase, partial [Acidimicrobiales bacterium]|nr:SAM-dependent methyltransferase [Acidimicrobiales bacterium]